MHGTILEHRGREDLAPRADMNRVTDTASLIDLAKTNRLRLGDNRGRGGSQHQHHHPYTYTQDIYTIRQL